MRLPCFVVISAWIYTVLTAMKQGGESLNASSLQFLGSVKRFIALSLQFSSQRLTLHRRYFLRKNIVKRFIALLLKRNQLLNPLSLLLFKVTLPTSAVCSPTVVGYNPDVIGWRLEQQPPLLLPKSMYLGISQRFSNTL
jgi:hypothetical protein